MEKHNKCGSYLINFMNLQGIMYTKSRKNIIQEVLSGYLIHRIFTWIILMAIFLMERLSGEILHDVF